MNCHTPLGFASRMALAGMLLWAIAGRADDIDEILNIEQTAAPDLPAPDRVEGGDQADSSAATIASDSDDTPSDLRAQLQAKDMELRRAAKEIERLQRALIDQEAAHQTEMQRSYYNMGCVYKASKQFERAEIEFLKVLAISPNDSATHYNLAILYDDDLRNNAKAREHYKKFLELAPDDKDARAVQEWLDALDKR